MHAILLYTLDIISSKIKTKKDIQNKYLPLELSKVRKERCPFP